MKAVPQDHADRPDVPGSAGSVRMGSDSKPWYRQFWPWFLIALPLSSVVLSFATLYVALHGADEVIPHEGDSASYSAPRAPSPAAGTADRAGPVQVGPAASARSLP